MSGLGNLKIVEQDRPSAQDLAKGEAGPKIAEAAYAVHSALGPGLDESIYRECFERELAHQGVPFRTGVVFPIEFRGQAIEHAFTVDFVVGGRAAVFIIAEEKSDLHELQIRSLLKLSGLDEAFIVNFRTADMRKGIMRAVVQKGNVLAETNATGTVN